MERRRDLSKRRPYLRVGRGGLVGDLLRSLHNPLEAIAAVPGRCNDVFIGAAGNTAESDS
jgi:hypothetical protein